MVLMLWLLISISILPRKTALTVSLSMTWISNNPLSPSPTGELLRNFSFFKESALKTTVYFLFIYLFCRLTPTSLTLRPVILIPQLLKFTAKKKIMGAATLPSKLLWHGGANRLYPGVLETFPFHPRRLRSHQRSARRSLTPLRAMLATHLHQEEVVRKRGSRWMCVMCVPFNLPDCWSSLGACSAAARWGWKPIRAQRKRRQRISIVLGLIKQVRFRTLEIPLQASNFCRLKF